MHCMCFYFWQEWKWGLKDRSTVHSMDCNFQKLSCSADKMSLLKPFSRQKLLWIPFYLHIFQYSTLTKVHCLICINMYIFYLNVLALKKLNRKYPIWFINLILYFYTEGRAGATDQKGGWRQEHHFKHWHPWCSQEEAGGWLLLYKQKKEGMHALTYFFGNIYIASLLL